MSSRPTEARRGVFRLAMRKASTGLREETRSPTGPGPACSASSAPTAASHGPSSTVQWAWATLDGSPDGARLGFGGLVRRGRFVDRYAGIYVADANGSNFHQVTSHAYNECGFAWSPDGQWILYGRANREGIYVIGADGRSNHRLTRDSPTPSLSAALSWAPDGRSIAYETDRTGNGDIYLIGADGHNQVQLTSSAAIDIAPSWQPR